MNPSQEVHEPNIINQNPNGGQTVNTKKKKKKKAVIDSSLENMYRLTSLFKASEAVPRLSGSIERRVSKRDKAEGGTFLNVSAKHRS
jgi:hypothetical protein